MLNRPPLRAHGDQLNEEYSLKTAKSYDPKEDRTRQEDAAYTDIHKTLQQFGVINRTDAPVTGEIDFDVGLHEALMAVAAARQAHGRLPANLRSKYPTWQKLLAAIERGDYETPENEATRKAAIDKAAREARIAEYEEWRNLQPPTPPPTGGTT